MKKFLLLAILSFSSLLYSYSNQCYEVEDEQNAPIDQGMCKGVSQEYKWSELEGIWVSDKFLAYYSILSTYMAQQAPSRTFLSHPEYGNFSVEGFQIKRNGTIRKITFKVTRGNNADSLFSMGIQAEDGKLSWTGTDSGELGNDIYIEDNVIYVNWKARYEIISDNYINDYDHYLDDDGSRYKLESFLYGIPY